MSFIVNPLSIRLGFSHYWRSLWYPNYFNNYAYLNIIDNYVFNYINWFGEVCKQVNIRKTIISLFYGSLADVCIIRQTTKIYIIVTLRLQKRRKIIKKVNKHIFPITKLLKKKKINKWKIFFKNDFFDKYFLYCISSRYKNKQLLYSSIVKTFLIFLLYNKNIKSKPFKNYWKKQLLYNIIMYDYIYNNFYFLKYFFTPILQKYFCNNLDIVWHCVLWPMETLSALLIVTYIGVKLRQKYYIKTILNKLFVKINIALKTYQTDMLGIKICVSGRFSRKERKMWWWRSVKRIGYSSVSIYLDYCASRIILLNSICGIKVWMNQTLNPNSFKQFVIK